MKKISKYTHIEIHDDGSMTIIRTIKSDEKQLTIPEYDMRNIRRYLDQLDEEKREEHYRKQEKIWQEFREWFRH